MHDEQTPSGRIGDRAADRTAGSDHGETGVCLELSAARGAPDRAGIGRRWHGHHGARRVATDERTARAEHGGRQPAGRWRRIGAELIRVALPDGYTLLVASGTLVTHRLLSPANYDPLRDFGAISQMSRQPFVLVVNPAVPVTSNAEFIAYAGDHPGKLN